LLMLACVALAGIGLAAVAQVWSTASQRDREAELLFIGQQFRAALASYYEQSPGAKQYPRSIDELLEDKRFPVPKRHLRRVYRDPMTGRREWGEVRYDQWLIGVHSLSEARPFKSALFRPEDAMLMGSERYADWRFVYQPAGFQSAALAAVTGAADAKPPPMPLTGQVVLQPAPTAAAPPRDRSRVQVPTEPWVCTATLGNDLRECQRTASAPAVLEACRQAAHSRSKACLGRAVAAGSPGSFGGASEE
jgi:hypothetical protein